MKIFGLLASVFCVLTVIGQKSYYFSDPLPSLAQKVENIDPKDYGIYKSDKEARAYEFNEEGIFIISTSIASLSRKTVRESSQYSVRNNYIFGVVKGDSIPCMLDGENYFFGVRNSDILVNKNSLTKLTKISAGKYIINHYENGFYTPELLTIERNKISFQNFSYELETTVFDYIETKKTIPSEHFDVVILHPSSDEFKQMLSLPVFEEKVTCKKQKK